MTSEELARLLEPAIEGLGYELCDLEAKLGGRDGVLRIFIDKPDGIVLEDCEKVSRQISAILDVEDPLPGQYALEVSSPGLDRRLSKPAHFERFLGEVVKIKLRMPLDGRRNYRGTLVAANEENIEVEVDGQAHSLPIKTIELARLVPSL
ncbi:ribosome maturation factor RimP [Woeseia oceani]|uniref:Ribosome maturation factor RimP n=1 Tax=Woeseia oceani TaxID=1548547 RepID=A0A193LGA9_9GAMM|nr:ribosome maturation factor RimP [Woeseia oceani]ANO51498.1 ribosome maturation factor RimP [Woeseia oceani]